MSGEDDIFDAWFANKELEKLERYLQRGRNFAHVSPEELRAAWIEEMRTWANDPRRPVDHAVHEEIEAELLLRKEELPFDQVKDAIEAIRRASREYIEELKRDPERYAREEQAIEDAVRRFEETTKAKKN